MLNITVPAAEEFDNESCTFFYYPEVKLQLEHSLIAVSKWESRWKKPFLVRGEKTAEEFMDYIRCMTINQNVDIRVYQRLGNENLEKIRAYIEDEHSATKIYDLRKQNPGKKETITAELIYYWMASAQIPFSCEKWHLNNLMNLLRIAEIKSSGKSNRMSKKDTYSQYKALNAARRAKSGSRG